MRDFKIVISLFVFLNLLPLLANAEEGHLTGVNLSGVVLDAANKPLKGVMVKAHNAERNVAKYVYTDAEGIYKIDRLWPGKYQVSTRRHGYLPTIKNNIEVRKRKISNLKLVLTKGTVAGKMGDPDYLEQLPDAPGKKLLRSVCIQCHGLTERIAFQKKTPEMWEATLDNMLGRIAPLPEGQREILLDYLNRYFGVGSNNIDFAPKQNTESPDQYSTNVTITEYQMPPKEKAIYDPSTGTITTAHDVRVDNAGLVWVSEMGRDSLVVLDPKTAKFKEYPVEHELSGPHGVIMDNRDDVWLTLIWADRIMKFDQSKQAFTIDFKIPGPKSWPHTIIEDSKGNLWFTEMYRNAIGKFNPDTGEYKSYVIPTPRSTPYGVTVDQQDNLWFAGLTYHKIGRIDAKTEEITEYPTPTNFSATRKITVDAKGNIWSTLFGIGKLARLDPKTGVVEEIALPSKYSSPYDLAVAPDGRVWFPDFTGNNIISYDPKQKTFAQYRIPTPTSRPRIIDIESDKVIWFSESEVGKVTRLELH